MIEIYLRRFEVEKKCCIAPRPVFHLDQIFLLFGWEESAVLYHILKNAFHLLLVHNFKFSFLQTTIKMNFSVGLNNRTLCQMHLEEDMELQKPIRRQYLGSLDLVNNAIFFKVGEG